MEKEIHNALHALEAGKLLLYPTDTVWGIGCDATNPPAVEAIYKLKKRQESKALICLVSDYNMLSRYVENIPNQVPDILRNRQNPTTVIYNRPRGLAPNLIADDGSLAIRICRDEFCRELIRRFGRPIVSTSANISGQPTPRTFAQISDEIINDVDYVVNLYRERTGNSVPSTILKVKKDGEIKIIRE